MKTTTNSAFLIFPGESPKLLYWNFQKPLLDALCICGRPNYADLLSEALQKTWSRRTFSRVSWWEPRSCEAASWIDLQNQGTKWKNISCTRESMGQPVDHKPATLSPTKRRHFQMFKRAYHEKWPLVTINEKGDTCTNSIVHSTVVKRLDRWTVKCGWQTASQLREIGKGGVQCRLPCDFHVKSGSRIYFMNVGICLLMCSWKLCCVPEFGDFCSGKCNFGVGMYAYTRDEDTHKLSLRQQKRSHKAFTKQWTTAG